MRTMVAVRMDDKLIERIEEQAKANGATRSQEILAALERAFLAPDERQTTSKARQLAAKVPGVRRASDISTIRPGSPPTTPRPRFAPSIMAAKPPENLQPLAQTVPEDACHHCGRIGAILIGGIRRCVGCNRSL